MRKTLSGMDEGLDVPGRSQGLVGVFNERYLLRLIVKKEISVRYNGSFLGLLWSYVKPGVQFLALYVALGVFLQMNKGTPNYAIYLFSGIVVINFYSEGFANAARSIVGNAPLIKKIFLPRQLFAVSSIWVSVIHFFPQVVVLLGACLFVGWRPSTLQLLAAIAGFGVVALFSLGLGLLFGALNVYFRDAENIVDLLVMLATWFSPVIYMFSMVQKSMAPWAVFLYQLNPLTVVVELFHWVFWSPTWSEDLLQRMKPGLSQQGIEQWSLDIAPAPYLLSFWLPVALVISLLILFFGEMVFRKLEGKFAQEL